MEKKGIGIGIENFVDMIDRNAYYVDKTLLIKEVIESPSNVMVFTRPRRFGKTLNMSMLAYFFDVKETKSAWAFEGLHISKEGKYKAFQNQYPVITMSLKDVVSTDFDGALYKFKYFMSTEYGRHRYLLDSEKLDDEQKAYIKKMIAEKGDQRDCEVSLRRLSEFLYAHYGQRVLILIDEYDVPLEKAYFARTPYYDDMVDFMREFYSALKTNNAIYKTVITGCLRIAKESIFTGLNNLEVISILSDEASEYFGFTESEVQDMLDYYDLTHKFPEAKAWYNGYEFGNTTVSNPWSIINYVKDMRGNFPFPRPHWSNTSSNSIVKSLIRKADADVKAEVEQMLQGGTIKKPIFEEVVYGEIEKNMDNLWSFLFLTGYLKKVSKAQIEEKIYLELAIPNREMKYIYDRQISDWFQEVVLKETNFEALYEGVRHGDTHIMERELARHMMESISYLDHYENFYHGFVAGILKGMSDYIVLSNRESGFGRSDLFLKGKALPDKALILEVKVAKNFLDLEKTAKSAVRQIEEKNYEQDLLYDGYQEIETYGVAFFRKRCKVVRGK